MTAMMTSIKGKGVDYYFMRNDGLVEEEAFHERERETRQR
jgi:hypothetical protein